MNKSKLTIEESLNKIKFMMNYDSSRTLTEQLEYNGQRIFGPGNKELLQKYQNDLKQMFDYTDTYREQLSKVPRGISDDQISAMSKTLFSTMQGIGLNKKPIANVFEMLKSASDFVALNDSFNSVYGAKQDLYSWIIGETGMGVKVQQRILTSLQNLMTSAAKGQPAEIQTDTTQPTTPQKITGSRYERSTGEEEDPYRYGTEGEGIKTIQELMGLVPDGRFGPKTRAALSPLGIQTFTKYDIPNLQAKIQGKELPQESPERNIAQVKPTTAPIAQLKGGIPKFGQAPPQKLA